MPSFRISFCKLGRVFFLTFVVLFCLGPSYPSFAQSESNDFAVEHRSLPEFGFYAKDVNCDGIPIRGSEFVHDQTLITICGRLAKMLQKLDLARQNMMQRGVELHVVGINEKLSALPEYRDTDQSNNPNSDTSVYETCYEAEHDGNDAIDQCTRRLAISILLYGFDDQIRKHIEEQFRSSRIKGLWNGSAAASSSKEYWAQLSIQYFSRREGPTSDLPTYDPGGYALLERIYSGLERPIAVEAIRARSVSKLAISKVNHIHAQIQLVNNGPKPIRILWMDPDGRIRTIGDLGAYNRTIKDTFLSQVWVVQDQRGVELDRFIVEDAVSEYIAAD
jgi:hypothetical protein